MRNVNVSGLTGITSIMYSRDWGMAPGRIVVRAVNQDTSRLPRRVSINFNDDHALVYLPDCLLVSSEQLDSGGEITVTYLDARWKWAYPIGNFTAWYNRRDIHGGIYSASEFSAAQIAQKCMDNLLHSGFQPVDLPTNSFPEIRHEVDNPALALSELCERYGCALCLGWDGVLRAYSRIRTKPMPNEDKIPGMAITSSASQPIADEVIVYGRPTRFEFVAQLEPVGIDLDLKIKPIEELSYRPRGGWFTEYDLSTFEGLVEEMEVSGKSQDEINKVVGLARQSIYRMYRVSVGLPGRGYQLRLPQEGLFGQDPYIYDLEQILPIEENLVDEKLPALIWGSRSNKSLKMGSEDDLDDNKIKMDKFISEGWRLDGQRGIVHFGEPTYDTIMNPVDNIPLAHAPAKLYLWATCGYRDLATLAEWRYAYRHSLTGVPADRSMKDYVRDERLCQHVWITPGTIKVEKKDRIDPKTGKKKPGQDRVRVATADLTWGQEIPYAEEVSNREQVDIDGKLLATSRVASLTSEVQRMVTYAGIKLVELDGQISSVSISMGVGTAAVTTVTKGFAHGLLDPLTVRRREDEALFIRGTRKAYQDSLQFGGVQLPKAEQ